MSSTPTKFKFFIDGGGTINNSCVLSPVQTVSGEANWLQPDYDEDIVNDFSAGFHTFAAIKSDGTLWLWGNALTGKLGNNTAALSRSSPVQTVSTGTNWKQVSVGCGHSGAIKTDGTLWMWGVTGLIGNSYTRSSPTQTISGGNNWKQLSLSCWNSAAVKTDGTLWLWGCNGNGQLGDNSTTAVIQSSPVQTVSTGTNWKQVSLGHAFAGAIKTDGTLWLWGFNSFGQLGNNSIQQRSSPVQTLTTGTNWAKVSTSACNTAAIKTDGTLWIWGRALQGGAGRYTTSTAFSSPVQTVSSGTNWKQVSLGNIAAAAIKTDGTLWTWGNNSCGFLGTGVQTVTYSSPVQTLSSGTNWKSLPLNGTVQQTTGAVKSDGTLWVWGYNVFGTLGINTGGLGTNVSSPVQTISTTTDWTDLYECAWCSFSAGQFHSAAIKTDGTLWLWGDNSCNLGSGALGNNSTTNRSSPVQTVSTGTNWKQVAVNALNSAAIKTDGTLWLWGGNFTCQIGNNSNIAQSSPVQTISTGTNWKQVGISFTSGVGCAHVSAIKTDGTLWLWGGGADGQLGNSSTTNRNSPVQTVSTGTNWRQVSVGSRHSTAIKTDGTLWLWGFNNAGQLGNFGNLNDRSSPIQTVSTGADWKQVSAGGCHTAAIKTDGTLWVWGIGTLGQLGTDLATSQSSPVQTVSTGTNWKQVSSGDNHTASVKTDGTLWMWGVNACGRLGDGSTVNRSSPVQTVSTGTNWNQVSIGGTHSLALDMYDELYVWGNNDFGQLALDRTCIRPGAFDLDDFYIRRDFFVEGGLWAWGFNSYAELGNNLRSNRSSPVQTVSGGTNWKQVSAGIDHTAAIKTDGTLWLWGLNLNGLLGSNNNTPFAIHCSPVQTVSTGINWKQVSLGSNLSSSIKSDGTLWLWGINDCGQLGNNNTINRSSPVQTVSTGTNWKQVSAGSAFSAAIKTDGTLWLWGYGGSGNFGNNSTINRSSPVQTVTTGTNWKQVSISAVEKLSSAVKTDGTLWLWGRAFGGLLGTNNTIFHSSPVQTVSTGTNWKQVSVSAISAAIKTDGTLWLWGPGSNFGGLGDNLRIDQSSPVQTVSTGTNWKQVSGSAAIKTDGTLWIWGYGGTGTLGNNSTINLSSPVQTVSTGTNWKQVSDAGGGVIVALRENCW